MVNASEAEGWADEDSATNAASDDIAGRATGAALAMEQTVRESIAECLILRGGLFYGRGTGFDDDWFSRAQAGKLRLPGDGQQFVSLVHITDMAAATALAIERWPGPDTLIVADDRPARWSEIFGYIAHLVGASEPQPGGRAGFPSFRVSNARARTRLGWAPHYTHFRAGLAR
jgi:nucleoside-diphosphate-sugar epimerase